MLFSFGVESFEGEEGGDVGDVKLGEASDPKVVGSGITGSGVRRRTGRSISSFSSGIRSKIGMMMSNMKKDHSNECQALVKMILISDKTHGERDCTMQARKRVHVSTVFLLISSVTCAQTE